MSTGMFKDFVKFAVIIWILNAVLFFGAIAGIFWLFKMFFM